MDIDAEVATCTIESALPGSVCDVEQKLSRHIAIEHDGEDVVLSVDDGEVHWCRSEAHWVAGWRWAYGDAPGRTSVLELLSTRTPGCVPSKRRSFPRYIKRDM